MPSNLPASLEASIILLQVLEPISYHENPKAVDPLSWQIRKAEADVYMQGIAARTRENLGENAPVSTNEKQSRVEYFIREGKDRGKYYRLCSCRKHRFGCDQHPRLRRIEPMEYQQCHPEGDQPDLSATYSSSEPITNRRWKISRIRYRRILLPIDSSRRAECALPAGIALAHGEIPVGLAPEGSTALPENSAPVSYLIQNEINPGRRD